MPYIPSRDRMSADMELQNAGLSFIPENEGELNFVISTFIANYLKEYGCRYVILNEVIGVLECAKLELYRKIGGPYEDVKESENGPVYHNIIPTKEY